MPLFSLLAKTWVGGLLEWAEPSAPLVRVDQAHLFPPAPPLMRTCLFQRPREPPGPEGGTATVSVPKGLTDIWGRRRAWVGPT